MVFKDWLFIGSELLKDPPLKILPAFLPLRDSWISLWGFLSLLSAKMHGREVSLLLAGAAVESRQGNLHICSSGQGASRGDGGALGNAERCSWGEDARPAPSASRQEPRCAAGTPSPCLAAKRTRFLKARSAAPSAPLEPEGSTETSYSACPRHTQGFYEVMDVFCVCVFHRLRGGCLGCATRQLLVKF